MKTVLLCLNFLLIAGMLRAQTNNDAANRKLIIGKWVSNQDKKYEVVFTATNKLEYYEGKLDTIANSNNNYFIRNDSLIVGSNSPDPNDKFYYLIEGVSATNLSLTYLGRNNLLTFTRKRTKPTGK